MRTSGAVLATSLSLAVAACATHHRPSMARPEEVRPPVGLVVEGIASWYGPGYDGKRTSSGEVYDQDALTAAHYNWAFGTQIRVTLLSTGRTVVVRINDRFPPWKGRLLDLSRGAARAIGLIGPGTGQVRVEILQGDEERF